MYQSVATIDSPEFLNLQPLDINPLMSKCEIKVFYVGENRNHTYISENVAAEIGKTLRGAPIVGYYKNSKQDFRDHGEKIIIDDEGVKFECQTVPYGFVSPDAQVWFQNFEDKDAFGNSVIHKYLMTTGYLWTGQFAQANLPIKQGRPQSMEFEKGSLQGEWQTNLKNGLDFFIINDAIIQKICILGQDVEPCFEGASVTAPDVSTKFTLDNKFQHTLYSMMQDLKNVLSRGGQQMENLENTAVEAGVVNEAEQPVSTFAQENENKLEAENELKDTSTPTDYVKKEQEDKEDSSKDSEQTKDDSEQDKQDKPDDGKKEDDEDEKEKAAKKYTALEKELEDLTDKYNTLNTQYQELVEFKNKIDNEQKEALIAEFYMLSDEDKADVIANKEKYTLDEIKSKLSVICFDKKVSFTLDKKDDVKEQEITTYNLNNENNNLPDWVKAVKEQQKLD